MTSHADSFAAAMGPDRGAVNSARVRELASELNTLYRYQSKKWATHITALADAAGAQLAVGEPPPDFGTDDRHLTRHLHDTLRRHPRATSSLAASDAYDGARDAAGHWVAGHPQLAEELAAALGQDAPAVGDGQAFSTLLSWTALLREASIEGDDLLIYLRGQLAARAS